ncbi:unnamed protein product [Brassica rapa subsp. trilocularis]
MFVVLKLMKLSGFRTKSTFISYIRMVARWSFGAVTRFGRAEPRRGRIVSHFVALLHIYSEVKTFIDLGVTIQSI